MTDWGLWAGFEAGLGGLDGNERHGFDNGLGERRVSGRLVAGEISQSEWEYGLIICKIQL